jgi:surfactin synthase thioesterase subunit
MLGARLYPEAASLAGRMIALNPNEFVTSMGGKIAMECDRLVQADELEAAQRLLLAARDINPPLPGRLLERLRETEAELQRRLAEKRGR